MTVDVSPGAERVLLSYDVKDAPRGRRVYVCQIIFGRTRSGPPGRTRLDPGFIHRPGVVWVGQSVLILPARDAEELAAKLLALGVRVTMGPVAAEISVLERFRRGALA